MQKHRLPSHQTYARLFSLGSEQCRDRLPRTSYNSSARSEAPAAAGDTGPAGAAGTASEAEGDTDTGAADSAENEKDQSCQNDRHHASSTSYMAYG